MDQSYYFLVVLGVLLCLQAENMGRAWYTLEYTLSSFQMMHRTDGFHILPGTCFPPEVLLIAPLMV